MANEPSFMDKIDRFFDAVDNGIDHVGKTIDSTRRVASAATGHELEGERAPSSPSVDVGAGSPALVRQRWKVIDAIDTDTGAPIFIVTDGTLKAECRTRSDAESLRRKLEAAA